jgi:hypothetical protein
MRLLMASALLVASTSVAAANTVVFFGSRLENKIREKKVVNDWLDEWAPHVKPCLADSPGGTVWNVKLEIAKDGTPGNGVATSKSDDKPKATAADKTVAACVKDSFKGLKVKGTAKAVQKVSADFIVK